MSSLSKKILVLEKDRSQWSQIWAVAGLSHLGDLMFHQKYSVRDMMHEWACSHDEVANHQLPIALAF